MYSRVGWAILKFASIHDNYQSVVTNRLNKSATLSYGFRKGNEINFLSKIRVGRIIYMDIGLQSSRWLSIVL
jgi:hypothetical protein